MFASDYCIYKNVRLPDSYHLDHENFNKKLYEELDLPELEEIHNSKHIISNVI